MHHLTGLEIVIFVIYTVVIVGIGFWTGKKGAQSTSNYFLAGRVMPWYAIGFSLIATSISTEQFIGEVGFAYRYGLSVSNWEWLCWPAQGLLLFFFLPIYLKSRIYTIPEYLTRRFGELAGTAFAFICIATYLFINLPLVLYSGGFVLNKIFGMDIYLAIWLLVITGGAFTIYGGLSAVVWTEVLQGSFLIGAGLLVFFLGVDAVPGGITEIIGTGTRAKLMLPASHPDLPWTAMISVAIVSSGFYYATNQVMTQRCLAAKSEWHGKMGIVFAGFLALPLALCVTWPGMIAYALNKNLPVSDDAYPFLVNTLIPGKLRGVVFAGLVCAIMSTINSLINSSSSLITMDVYKKLIRKNATDKHLVRFSQISGIVILAGSALWSPLVGKWTSIFAYVQECFALMVAPCMAVFIVAIFWKRATKAAAVATLLCSFPLLIIVYIRQFGGFLTAWNIYNLAAVIFILCIGLMVLVSLFTRPVAAENLRETIWHPDMLKLPPDELAQGYPWWKRIGLWWAVLVLIFVLIYARYW